jgi:hypothetical protein
MLDGVFLFGDGQSNTPVQKPRRLLEATRLELMAHLNWNRMNIFKESGLWMLSRGWKPRLDWTSIWHRKAVGIIGSTSRFATSPTLMTGIKPGLGWAPSVMDDG